MSDVAEERYRALVERSIDGILLQADGVIVFANQAARRLVGADHGDDLVGRRIDAFLPQPYLAVVREELLDPATARMPIVEQRLICLDGSEIDVEVSAVPFVFQNRPSVQLVLRDIRERVKRRVAFVWAESQFRVLADQMPFVMWTTDAEGRMVSVIGDATSAFGRHATEALTAHSVLRLGDEVDPQAPGIPYDAAGRTMEVNIAGRCYLLQLEPLRDAHSEVVGQIGVAFDITPWMHTQVLLRDGLRMDAVGDLAGGVAHEINNVLAIIGGQASLLARRAESAASAQASRRIIEATGRAAAVTRNLLAFARRDVHRPVRLSVNDLVRDVAEMTGRAAPASVAIALRLGDVPDIFGDESALYRALANICWNAVDAMPDGGRLTIGTAAVPEGALAGESGAVRLRVTDTGIGMTEETRAHVFEPFYSAFHRDRHVGLGLSMAQGVVVQHHGTIRIESVVDVGTTLTIDLPAATPGPPVGQEATPRPAASRAAPDHLRPLTDVSRRPMALLVDDEAMLRSLSMEQVGTLGYEGVEVDDGVAAVERFRESPGQFAFVLLDVLMPRMSGVEALGHMLGIDPDVRVILCSGYPRDELAAHTLSDGAIEYLGKPYSLTQLAAAIHKVTGRTMNS